jgi:REP element-mobilizing transposase RayT
MSRPLRINVPGGTYYIVQRGGAGRMIFSCPEDYSTLERLLATALRRNRATAHAYCWTPDAIHLVIRTGETPIGRLMQGLTSRYARAIHKRDGGSGHFFGARYQASLLDPDAYLLRLTHYVHQLPVILGLASHPDSYAHTSHAAYLGTVDRPWINTRAALSAIDVEQDPVKAYEQLMARSPAECDVELFRYGGRNDLRVIGGPEFLAGLPRHARKYRSKISLDQIIHAVTQALGVERDHVMSSSRRRELALARALIAWFAIERRVATLTEVARRLNRDPSTLSVAISRYSVSRQDLFRLNSLHYLTPVGSSEVPAMHARSDEDENWLRAG